MALVINDGIVSNDNNPWIDYYVLDNNMKHIYRIYMNIDNTIYTEIILNVPEQNEIIIDGINGKRVQLTIIDGELTFPYIINTLNDKIDLINSSSTWRPIT